MMRKTIWSSVIILFVVAGCLKSNHSNTCNYNDTTIIAPTSEVNQVQSYLSGNGIIATQHANGFFYKIVTPGSGQVISNLCSNLVVKYTGKLTNGSVFDSTGTGTATFQLGQVIPGWQKGLPLITKGGKITLYIPPSLGYGGTDVKNSAGAVVIPANSILIFDIELVDIG